MRNRWLIAVGLMLVMAACSLDVETEIVGTWEGDKQDLVFHEDGRVLLKDKKYSDYKGTYAITDGNRLVCEFDSFQNPVVRTAKISGDKLILTEKNGREEVYRRQ